jgi:hypothetical protein
MERKFYADQTLLKDLGLKNYIIRAIVERKTSDDKKYRNKANIYF